MAVCYKKLWKVLVEIFFVALFQNMDLANALGSLFAKVTERLENG